MTGIALQGAEIQLNALTALTIPLVQTSTPGSGNLGQYWVAAASGAISIWNGSSWVSAPTAYYLALLTADPTGLTTIATLTEVSDPTYARQQVVFGAATNTAPSQSTNTAQITFGPFTNNMTLPAQWAALVSVVSGTSGLLLGTWTLNQPQQVLATQSINVAAGQIEITTS